MYNYIEGQWRESTATDMLPVVNPATGDELDRTPLSSAEEVDQAARAAAKAFPGWRRVPVAERIQYLFRLKMLLEEHIDDIARTITMEAGKTLGESRAEMRRAIENVEVACGAPILSQGYNSEDIASGIDEMMIRQPLGVCAIIAPFNFPGMIPFWFLPYAIACGNTVVDQAIRARAADDAEGLQAARQPDAARGSRQSRQRRTRGRQRDPGPPDDPVRQLRRVERHRAPRLLTRRGGRQARAMSGRRQEPGHRHARRRHGVGVGNHRRQRVRLRRPALPRVLVRRGRWRGLAQRSRRRSRRKRRRGSPAMDSRTASRWARSSAPKAARASSS